MKNTIRCTYLEYLKYSIAPYRYILKHNDLLYNLYYVKLMFWKAIDVKEYIYKELLWITLSVLGYITFMKRYETLKYENL